MTKKPKKTRSRRDSVKLPNLQAKYSPRIRGEYIDYDYLDQLSEKDKDWLDQFTGEFHGASFKKDGTDIQSYEKYGKDCNDRNNSANRDTYGILKNKANKHNNKRLVNYDAVGAEIENQASREINPMSLENAYTEYLEFKEIEAFIQEYDEAMFKFTENE